MLNFMSLALESITLASSRGYGVTVFHCTHGHRFRLYLPFTKLVKIENSSFCGMSE